MKYLFSFHELSISQSAEMSIVVAQCWLFSFAGVKTEVRYGTFKIGSKLESVINRYKGCCLNSSKRDVSYTACLSACMLITTSMSGHNGEDH